MLADAWNEGVRISQKNDKSKNKFLFVMPLGARTGLTQRGRQMLVAL